jgi:hypothetical protein
MFSNSLKSVATAALLAVAACSDSTGPAVAPGFLGGTSANHEIGVVIGAKTLTLFQLGSPATQKHYALGTSATVTPTGFSLGGRRAAVPLGNAASVAVIDLVTDDISYYQFASGNATGSAFVDDTTIVVANTATNVVGRIRVGQAGAITTTVPVCDSPTAIKVAGGRIYVICGNLQGVFPPVNNGMVTVIDAKTFAVVDSIQMGGTNSSDAALGPDGLLYVVNTADYAAQGSLTILNPANAHAPTTIDDIGVGPGAISIDETGVAYLSSFASATTVWNTKTHAFVRDTGNPVCAKVAATGQCRSAFSTATSADGSLYQVFLGSPSQGLAPYVFVYAANTFSLRDSISVGAGPAAIQIRTF